MWTTETLAEFVSQKGPADVPSPTRELVRRCVLDLLGAAAAGQATAAAGAMRGVAATLGAPGPATVWFTGDRRHPAAAALANSAAASALDADDGHRRASGHPGAAIIPSVFATAEATGASGADVLTAIVLGYEVGVRIAGARTLFGGETVATGRWSAYGAAAAAGWLRRLPADRLAHALAIAGAHAPDLPRLAPGHAGRAGDMIKEGIPWATVAGLIAVELAERGVTGKQALLDNPEHFRPDEIVDGLGKTWLVEGTYFKPYACCRWIHAPLDAFFALQVEHDIQAAEITRLRVDTFAKTLTLNNHPDPASSEAAQFSTPFCLAVAAHEGPAAFLPLSPDLLGRADLVELAKRVELRLDPSLDAQFPAKVSGRVAVETPRGRWERLVEHPLGDPANPMELARMESKFLRLTDRCWTPETQERAVAAALSLDAGGWPALREILGWPPAGP